MDNISLGRQGEQIIILELMDIFYWIEIIGVLWGNWIL